MPNLSENAAVDSGPVKSPQQGGEARPVFQRVGGEAARLVDLRIIGVDRGQRVALQEPRHDQVFVGIAGERGRLERREVEDLRGLHALFLGPSFANFNWLGP